MQKVSLPPVRVRPELRADAESLLKPGETLSAFIAEAVERRVSRLKAEAEYVRRGLAAKAESEETGRWYSVEEVVEHLHEVVDRHDPGNARRRPTT